VKFSSGWKAIERQISLADRFGVQLSFYAFLKELLLAGDLMLCLPKSAIAEALATSKHSFRGPLAGYVMAAQRRVSFVSMARARQ